MIDTWDYPGVGRIRGVGIHDRQAAVVGSATTDARVRPHAGHRTHCATNRGSDLVALSQLEIAVGGLPRSAWPMTTGTAPLLAATTLRSASSTSQCACDGPSSSPAGGARRDRARPPALRRRDIAVGVGVDPALLDPEPRPIDQPAKRSSCVERRRTVAATPRSRSDVNATPWAWTVLMAAAHRRRSPRRPDRHGLVIPPSTDPFRSTAGPRRPPTTPASPPDGSARHQLTRARRSPTSRSTGSGRSSVSLSLPSACCCSSFVCRGSPTPERLIVSLNERTTATASLTGPDSSGLAPREILRRDVERTSPAPTDGVERPLGPYESRR